MDDKEQIKKIITPPKPRKVNIEKLFVINKEKPKVSSKIKKNKNKKKY